MHFFGGKLLKPRDYRCLNVIFLDKYRYNILTLDFFLRLGFKKKKPSREITK